ncbi:MAG: polynucleotide adenylyltransferase PcnB, partial [Gammaproteobacteria bacterium]|nr:polynucleotide adenylyltransferase PcnB [Gammaproteobacteria bacterium]
AYLVGGGVRDLLLGGHPKDFDIATNATPEQVHNLFRNSRLIGRRFKIVHVVFGREIIEVTTFRGSAPVDPETDNEDGHEGHAVGAHGQLLRDNIYGSKEEDALRRDFTVNALYYCIRDFTVHDYANGLSDLQQRTLRLIGDPQVRYREDPVRMLRAVRFAAKLDFRIADDAGAPIPALADLLHNVPPARLFEEVLKLLAAGHGLRTYELMTEYDLFGALFPASAEAIEDDDTGRFDRLIRAALENTDARVHEGKSVSPYFLYAALLWPALEVARIHHESQGESPYQALHMAANDVVDEQIQYTAVPRRFSVPMKEIWDLQQRLPKRQGKRAELLLEHPRFRAGYDFLLLREAAGENTGGLGTWWTRYQQAEGHVREDLLHDAPVPAGPRKRRRRKRKPAARS